MPIAASASTGAPVGPLPGPALIRVAQYNVENLFDTKPDPTKKNHPIPSREEYDFKLGKLASAIRDTLEGAELISLNEVENETVLRDLVNRPELKALGYQYAFRAGNDVRGINVAMLYRSDSIELGNIEQPNPELPTSAPARRSNDGARRRDDGGDDDVRRLFARPPLIVDVKLRGAAQAAAGAQELTLVVNHFKSKIGGDWSENLRRQQAEYVGGIVDARRAAQPMRDLLVLGDLNTLPGEEPLKRLMFDDKGKQRLEDVDSRLPKGDRYTYIYRGQKNQLDHVLATGPLAQSIVDLRIPHINTGATDAQRRDRLHPGGASDHDPILATIDLTRYAQVLNPTSPK